jgi:hypothetical protein
MAKNLGTIKALMWIGIVLFLLWFLIITFAPSSMLESLDFVEVEGYFLRMYGILPLGFAILFFLALKDIEKNILIIKGAIIVADLVVIANVIYHFAVERVPSWFLWTSMVILFVYSSLLFLFKPKTA